MKIAFVIPWYGKDIPGGAENECRKTALNLKARGFDVEILTTCVKDFHSNWNKNYHREAIEIIEGLPVRRFKVKKRDTKRFDAVNYKLMNTDMAWLRRNRVSNPVCSPVSADEESIYINEMINSPALYDHIESSYNNYDFFIFIPYMFGTTYFGSMRCGEKAVLIPCLHDESYAYMSIYKDMFKKAKGIIFHASAEGRLAERLYGSGLNGVVAGEGIDTEFTCKGERFLKKYSIDSPFILYAGRKDTGKNTPLLVDYFCRYKGMNKGGSLKFVLMGSGNISMPSRQDIVNLGFMPEQDKYDAYAAALYLCQPSVNESFSIVIMESWAAGTPVIVHGGCEVTKDFCIESNGGLYFSSYAEFAECMDFLIENSDIRNKMGENGRSFVKNNFSWNVVTKKLIAAMKGWKGDDIGDTSDTAKS